jgi:putative pyruvate formate lyase activating enzyme
MSVANPHIPTSGGREPAVPSLDSRIQAVKAILKSCDLCEIRCGANRLAHEPSPCGLGAETYCFKRYVSFTEEVELVPALRVYLGGCNFRCRFCNTAPDCFRAQLGERVDPVGLASQCQAAVRAGVRTINVLGGEPSLHLHAILEVAAAAPGLPLVLNTNAYMTPKVLDLLAGLIHEYLVDFKFGNDECARRLAGVSRYLEVVTRNLGILRETESFRIRHLLMPGHLDCCFRRVVDWLSENLPGTRFRLLTSYVPGWRAETDRGLGRLNARADVRAAVVYLAGRDLDWSTDDDGHG